MAQPWVSRLDVLSQTALDLLPAPAFLTSVPEGTILRCNRRAAALCGPLLGAHEHLGLMLRSIDADPTAVDPIADALRRGAPLDNMDALLEIGGRRIVLAVSIAPIGGLDDAPIAALALCHVTNRAERASAPASTDIESATTAQQAAEAALRLSQQRLELALDAARLGRWEFDIQTQALTASARCKANHGLPPDAELSFESGIIGQVLPDHQERFRFELRRAIETRDTFEIEVPNTWPDGSTHWLLLRGQLVDDRRIVGVSMDITEKRRAEEALVEADRLKNEFLAVVAHEMRNPLAPIINAASVLQKIGPTDPLLVEQRAIILRQARHLVRLIDDLLDVGRIIAGKLRLEKRLVELNVLLKHAADTCAALIEGRGHELAFSPSEAPIHVEADDSRIVQVVCNLLNNAAKYMQDGGRIDLFAREEGGLAVIRVRDRGDGIAPEMLERIFNRFIQVGSADYSRSGGLGIGLSLVRALTELHGGSVEVRSEGLGKGSEFVVRLPLAEARLSMEVHPLDILAADKA